MGSFLVVTSDGAATMTDAWTVRVQVALGGLPERGEGQLWAVIVLLVSWGSKGRWRLLCRVHGTAGCAVQSTC